LNEIRPCHGNKPSKCDIKNNSITDKSINKIIPAEETSKADPVA